MKLRQPRSRRRSRVQSVALLTVLALAVGCGQKLDGDAGSKTENELVYWSVWNANEPQSKIIKSAMEDFGKQTGIKVDFKVRGRNQGQAVQEAVASGHGPDLFDSATDGLPEARARGLLADLDPILDAEVPGEGKTVREVLPKTVRKAAGDDKGLAMMPHTLMSTALWYDAKRHPELTANPPKTFDEFLDLLDTLKASGQAPIAQDGLVNTYNIYWFYWLLMRHAGPGSLRDLGTTAKAWDNPEVLNAAEDVERLVKGDYFQDGWTGTKYPTAQTAWAKGKHVLNLNGSWLPSETKSVAAEDAEPRSFQFPTVPGGHRSVEVGTLGLAISAKAKHPKAAAKFLEFFLQKKYQKRFSTEADNIPARADVPAPKALIDVQKAVASASEYHPTYDQAPGAAPEWWEKVLLPLDDKLLSGKLSAEQFVARGKAKTADVLKNKGE
jgi:raffinose/stachyose/melibiose transport system substrate-binding protein